MSDKFEVGLEAKDPTIVTYQELEKDLSHFEIAFLSFHKALDIIRSATYLNTYSKTKYKPKVAVIALNELCLDREKTLLYAQQIKSTVFNYEDVHTDEYNVDEGHLPGNERNGHLHEYR